MPVAVDASGAAQHDAVFKVDRGRVGHAFTVSSVVWYAIDTGLFVSGSFDKTVKACRHLVSLAAQRPCSAVPSPPCQLPTDQLISCPAQGYKPAMHERPCQGAA